MTEYPFEDGDVIRLGPECFVDRGRNVICYQGENFYRPEYLRMLAGEPRRDFEGEPTRE